MKFLNLILKFSDKCKAIKWFNKNSNFFRNKKMINILNQCINHNNNLHLVIHSKKKLFRNNNNLLIRKLSIIWCKVNKLLQCKWSNSKMISIISKINNSSLRNIISFIEIHLPIIFLHLRFLKILISKRISLNPKEPWVLNINQHHLITMSCTIRYPIRVCSKKIDQIQLWKLRKAIIL